MPYITIHAQRKSRAIWRLVNSLDLHENLFLDSNAAENNDGENSGANGAGGEGSGAESGGDGKDNVRSANVDDDDIVDSDDEMDDEGEEFDVNLTGGDEGKNGNTSLVCTYLLLSAYISFEFYFMLCAKND